MLDELDLLDRISKLENKLKEAEAQICKLSSIVTDHLVRFNSINRNELGSIVSLETFKFLKDEIRKNNSFNLQAETNIDDR
jgi:hypothetical protein